MTLHGKSYKEKKSKHSTQWVSQPFWKDTFQLVRRKERFVSSLPAHRCAPQRPLISCPVPLPPTTEHSTAFLNWEAAAAAQPAEDLREPGCDWWGAHIPRDSRATIPLRRTVRHSKTARRSGLFVSHDVRHCLNNFQNILWLLLLHVIYFCLLHPNSASPLL